MKVNFPAVSQIDAYWEGLRDGRLMPKRSEVDPRGMEGALEYAMLMELVAPGVARIRVSGMHLTDLLGMEVRGMPLTAFFEPQDRPRIAAVLDEVVGTKGSGPKVIEVSLASPGGIGRPELQAKLYLAPLASERDGRPRILACLQAKGTVGRAPRRFQIADIHKRRIMAAAGAVDLAQTPQETPVPNVASPAPGIDNKAPGFAENTAEFERDAEPTNPAERPYLRLVKSDDSSAG
jgi:hypothetical protein